MKRKCSISRRSATVRTDALEDTHGDQHRDDDPSEHTREHNPLSPTEQADKVLETVRRFRDDAKDGDEDRSAGDEDGT